MHRQLGLDGQTLVKAAQEAAAAGEVDTGFEDVGREFGRGHLQGVEHRGFDFENGTVEGVGYLGIVDDDFFGNTGKEVAPLNGIFFGRSFEFGHGRSHLYLDAFGRGVANADVVARPHIVFDVLVKVVAGNFDGLVAYNTAQGDDGNFAGTAAYIHNHVAVRFEYVKADTDGRRHGFVNEAHLSRARLFGRVAHRPFFYFGNAGGNTDNHFERGGKEALFDGHLFDELAHHAFSGLKVGNNPVFHGADGLDVFGGFALHEHGVLAHGQHPAGGTFEGNDGGFVHHHLVVIHDNRVGRTKVNRDFAGHE